jgi:hypothetical protein
LYGKRQLAVKFLKLLQELKVAVFIHLNIRNPRICFLPRGEMGQNLFLAWNGGMVVPGRKSPLLSHLFPESADVGHSIQNESANPSHVDSLRLDFSGLRENGSLTIRSISK